MEVGDVVTRPAARQFQHFETQIDVIDGCAAVLLHQLQQKSPVAAPQHQHPPRIRYIIEKRASAPLQLAAEPRVFEPAVPTGNGVKIQISVPASGRNSRGVNKATSASTRNASRDNRLLPRSSATKANALAASAPLNTGR